MGREGEGEKEEIQTYHSKEQVVSSALIAVAQIQPQYVFFEN